MTGKGRVISTEAGATLEGKPFVVTSVGDDVIGQLTPAEAIAMGTRFIQHGIEAERDAGMVRFLRSQNVGEEAIGSMIQGMRDHRQQHEPAEGRVGA